MKDFSKLTPSGRNLDRLERIIARRARVVQETTGDPTKAIERLNEAKEAWKLMSDEFARRHGPKQEEDE